MRQLYAYDFDIMKDGKQYDYLLVRSYGDAAAWLQAVQYAVDAIPDGSFSGLVLRSKIAIDTPCAPPRP